MNVNVSTEITEQEQNILKKRLMFNDNVLNFYLEYLESKYGDKSICILSTFFFENMRRANDPNVNKEGQFIHCSRWFSKKQLDFKELEYIIIPINVGKHWTLLIYCLESTKMVGNGKRKFYEEYEFDNNLNVLYQQIQVLTNKINFNLSFVDSSGQLESKKYNECNECLKQMKNLINEFEISCQPPQEKMTPDDELPFEQIAPCILNLDSLDLTTTPQCISYTISEFISWMYEKNNIYWDDVSVEFIHTNVPQQASNWECGEYVLYFVRVFLQFRPKTLREYEALLKNGDPTNEKRLIQKAALEMGFH